VPRTPVALLTRPKHARDTTPSAHASAGPLLIVIQPFFRS
jgi:hypothetical protein